MLRRFDRVAVVLVTALVGLTAIVAGWTMTISGTVGGYGMPADWFSDYSPFSDYLVPGLLLLVVVGAGGVLTAMVCLNDTQWGSVAALVYGLVLIGWIVGELVFLTQTMVLTWVV